MDMHYGCEIEDVLPELSVIRDTYLDQKRTNDLCLYIFDKKPDLLEDLIEQEKIPFPFNRDALLRKAFYRIEGFFNDEVENNNIDPISKIQMVDLSFEIDRRVRRGLGLKDIPVVGKELMSGLDEELPELFEIQIPNVQGIDAEKFKEYLGHTYYSNKETVYAYCENIRRLMTGGMNYALLLNSIKVSLSSDHKHYLSYISEELVRQLNQFIEHPSYMELEQLLGDENGR